MPASINKFLVALASVIGELAIVLTMTPDTDVTASEWLLLAVSFLGALGVYAIPNAKAGGGGGGSVRTP